MKLLISVVALALLAVSQGSQVGIRSYSGYEVLKVVPQNEQQFDALRQIYNTGEFDFWLRPTPNGHADIMVSPEEKEILLPQLAGMNVSVKIEDVNALIAQEKMSQKPRAAAGKIEIERFNRYTEIEEWLLTLEASSDIVESVTKYGESFEGRGLYVVKLSTGGAPKPSLFIDANIHAREWITSATAVWLLNEFTTNTDAYADLLSKIDIYVAPMVNPDGYEFAQTNDRMWRKTRRPNSGSLCIGCDPNRNFAFQFGGESTSTNPCSDLFHGGSAFSQVETKALSDLIISLEGEGVRFGAYMTFHSYGQYWLLPWGYTSGVYPDDYPANLALGEAAGAAIRGVSGTRYLVGQGADVLYGVGGASDDWAKDHGIPYTVTVEMRDEGRYGFIPPATEIVPNAREILASVLVYANKVAEGSQ